ncbi:MAG: diguanylate cyclase [Pirellulaceae bacterium]
MIEHANKVLLVDDDPAMRRMVSKWLEGAGYRVRTAENGRDAVQAIEQERPQILLTDWDMPQMDGLSLCRWVRGQQQTGYIYTILFTMHTSSPDIIRGLDAGADDFCKKPIDRDELIARMRSGSRVIGLEQRLLELAHKDPLTGVLSRGALLEYISKEIPRSRRADCGLSCVMLDIDQLKQINDKHGHGVGDEALRRVAHLLAANARESDVVGRYGSEEFCVVLPECMEAGAAQWAERIRNLIKSIRIPLPGGEQLGISASFGAAQRKDDTHTVEQLVDMAEQAMMISKHSGRDRVAVYGSQSSHRSAGNQQNPAELLRSVPARTVMSLATPLAGDETLGSASEFFLRFRIGSAPVVDLEGKLAGILSEKDVMTTMLRPDWWMLTVADVMQPNVVSYEEETPAMLVYEFLCRVTIRSVVIVKEGKPTGLINRGSLLRFFSNLLAVRQADGFVSEAAAASQAIAVLSGNISPRKRMGHLVRSMASEAADLARRAHGTSSDLIPCVVGGATRLQDLIRDLLILARFADEHSDGELLAGFDLSHQLEAGAETVSAASAVETVQRHGEQVSAPL